MFGEGKIKYLHEIPITVKPVLRGHLWEKEKSGLIRQAPLKIGAIHIILSMAGQEKCYLLIQMTA